MNISLSETVMSVIESSRKAIIRVAGDIELRQLDITQLPPEKVEPGNEYKDVTDLFEEYAIYIVNGIGLTKGREVRFKIAVVLNGYTPRKPQALAMLIAHKTGVTYQYDKIRYFEYRHISTLKWMLTRKIKRSLISSDLDHMNQRGWPYRSLSNCISWKDNPDR